MKSQSPAVTHATLVATAGRKTHKVQRKLKQAAAELRNANDILVKAPARNEKQIEVAVEQNVAAEEKVQAATEELEVVKELLAEAAAESDSSRVPHATGQSGDGVKSLIPHLERRRSEAAAGAERALPSPGRSGLSTVNFPGCSSTVAFSRKPRM